MHAHQINIGAAKIRNPRGKMMAAYNQLAKTDLHDVFKDTFP
jgi:hypothetical protein